MIYIKVYKSTREVVAVCDEELLGRKFEEGKKQLDVRESFYKGENVSYKKTVEMMRRHSKNNATFNIVGPNSIKAAKQAGIITDAHIGKIKGIKFALFLG